VLTPTIEKTSPMTNMPPNPACDLGAADK